MQLGWTDASFVLAGTRPCLEVVIYPLRLLIVQSTSKLLIYHYWADLSDISIGIVGTQPM
jgi:hypothetical protein